MKYTFYLDISYVLVFSNEMDVLVKGKRNTAATTCYQPSRAMMVRSHAVNCWTLNRKKKHQDP